MRHKKTLFVIVVLIVIAVSFTECLNHSNSLKDARGNLYAGSATCMKCHQNIVNSYEHTNHYKTSSRASYNALQKLINSNNNTVAYTNNQKVTLDDIHKHFFQSYFQNASKLKSEKIDISFGSGEEAQTYAYWKDSQIFQLPLTYFTSLQTWTNSPGFPIAKPYFTRVVPSRCLECHTSFVRIKEEREGTLLRINEKFDSSSIIYGIDCERCHGPSAQHVKFQEENPTIKQAKFITSIKSLTRQQKLDMCASCHSGSPVALRSIFAFKPGDTLSKYYLYYNGSTGEPDVHGMQLQLLKLSKCFRQSNITCTTCHESHKTEVNNQEMMISKCMTCHQQLTHAVQMKAEGSNCITCHMPLRSSKSLDFNNETKGNNIQYMLRTHRIAIYPKTEWK